MAAVINSAQVPVSGNQRIRSTDGQDGSQSSIFFVNNQGFIRMLQAQDEPEQTTEQGANQYTENSLQVNGQNIKSSSKDLATLGYSWKGVNSTRLYYADGNTGTLREIGRDGDANSWSDGSLSQKGFDVEPNTPITAHVNFPSAQLKVYFYARGKTDSPMITWTTLGSSDWQIKPTK